MLLKCYPVNVSAMNTFIRWEPWLLCDFETTACGYNSTPILPVKESSMQCGFYEWDDATHELQSCENAAGLGASLCKMLTVHIQTH